MKTTIYIVATALIFCFAGNCSDNPEETASIPTVQNKAHNEDICPQCSDTSCIYYQIESEIIASGGDGTDQQIKDAAQRVFILRGITDSATIKNVLSNYYL